MDSAWLQEHELNSKRLLLALSARLVHAMKIEELQRQFHREVDTAAQAFFVWKTINRHAFWDSSVREGLNARALSWNILTHSLQNTFFIVLGRLFDTDSDSFSAHTFLKSCIANIDQFSKENLRHRKLEGSSKKEPEWLNEYLKNAYVPVEKDFQIMRGELSKQQKRYDEIYRPIRNTVVAHTNAATMDNVDALFGKTNVDDIEEFIWFFHQIRETVFQLLHNGRLTRIGDHDFSEEKHVAQDVRGLLEQVKV